MEINNRKQLSLTEWNQFVDLLNQTDFWTSDPIYRDIGLDGSEWTLEAHLKNKYWFMNRWSPGNESPLGQCGRFLIDLSGIEEKIY